MNYRAVFGIVYVLVGCDGTRVVPTLDGGGLADSGLARFDDAGVLDAGSVDADSGIADAGVAYDAGIADGGLADVQTVRFVAFGDQGKSNDAQRSVGLAVGTICAQRGCDFGLLLGDNFYPSGVSSTTDPLWETAFVQPYATVDAGFYVTLGNHDYGSNGAGTDFGKEQNEIDYSRVNPKWILPAHHYKFTAKHVEFYSGDTNKSMFKTDSAVREAFAQWTSSSTATWKIAFGHHNYLSNGEHGNAGNYDYLPINFFPVNGEGVKRFVEGTLCGQVDLYLSGHDHEREWLQTTCSRADSGINTEFIVSGGGSSATGFETAGINPYYWRSASSGFLYVVIEDRTLTGTFYDANGVAEFTRSFKK